MKIIFLDIDGVLCCHRVSHGMGERGLMEVLDPVGLRWLDGLTATGEVKIVISSTWRIGHDKCFFPSIFGVAGYMNLSISLHEDWRTEDLPGVRGIEIDAWLSKHDDIETYVILDDDSDMLEHQMDNFVKTDGKDGIMFTHMCAAEEILGIGKWAELMRENNENQ